MKSLNFARKVIEKFYDGVCSVSNIVMTKNELTGETHAEERTIYSGIPCRLSYKSKSAAAPDSRISGSKIEQEISLFIAPEVKIAPGSKITVAQYGVTREYEESGMSAVYPTHQEITLKLSEEYA